MQHVEVENLGGRMTTKVKPAKPLKSYHFDLGNSSAGPVGYCARIIATSKKAAVARLRYLLPEFQEVTPHGELVGEEYITVYFNYEPGGVTVADADDGDPVDPLTEVEEMKLRESVEAREPTGLSYVVPTPKPRRRSPRPKKASAGFKQLAAERALTARLVESLECVLGQAELDADDGDLALRALTVIRSEVRRALANDSDARKEVA